MAEPSKEALAIVAKRAPWCANRETCRTCQEHALEIDALAAARVVEAETAARAVALQTVAEARAQERQACRAVAKQVETEWRSPNAKMACRQISQRIGRIDRALAEQEKP